MEDGGYYSCNVINKGGYLYIWILRFSIILFNGKFCRVVIIKNERGIFYWYYIVVGGIVFLFCFVGLRSSLIDGMGDKIMVRRNCLREGVWMFVEV